jgi:hypothetical protein
VVDRCAGIRGGAEWDRPLGVKSGWGSLKRQADLVLGGENGSGVLELLDGPVFWGMQVLHPARWHVTV